MMGGLGNQLFQYSMVRSLSIDKKTDFLMNLSYYEGELAKSLAHLDFKLNHFNVDFNKQISEEELTNLNVKRIVEPLSSDNFAKFIDFKNYSDNIRLTGYWQDERYFKHNEHIIKNELQVVTPPNKKNQKMIDEISDVNSVCMSFRRGEYLDPYFIAQFGICTEEYYKKAINFMIKRVENPVFFIFSDDIEWIEDNVKLDYSTIPVNINGAGDEHEELRLMTLCDNFIMANSSFSWWGAWLSKNENKNVFAPTPWFNSFTKQSILCSDWIQLKCDRSDLFNKSNTKIYELVNYDDLNKLECTNIGIGTGKYGLSLIILNEPATIKLAHDDFSNYVDTEFLIEFKIRSEKKGLIKIDYGENRKIVLGYNKGHSNKYLHLVNIGLNDITLEMSDETLIIDNFTIKSVNSNFDLILSNK